MEQGEKSIGFLSTVEDHVESGTDSSSTSMAVEDSPAGRHDNESKPISKRRRLLQEHRVHVPVEEAIRAEITSYLQYAKQMRTIRWTKMLFCSGRPMCSLNT